MRQANVELSVLLSALDDNRAAMKQSLDARPSDTKRQLQARQQLLASLEAYAAALGQQNLPVPWRLRDELSLQRALAPR